MSQEREIERWVTVKGHRVPIYKDRAGISKKQRALEDTIRDDDKEHLCYLDADGNEIIHVTGDINEVEFDQKLDEDNVFNREVERAIWAGKDIHTTHNHLQQSIFSPDDIDSLVALENKSLTATVPSQYGMSAYRLIREQPVSKGTDERGVLHFRMDGTEYYEKDYTSELSPKAFARAYNEAYTKVWEPMGDEMTNLIRQFRWKKIDRAEYERRVAPMDKKIATAMEKWLKENASRYGFRFIKE